MAKKNVRNMKVCGQSGYKYETVPAITLKGKWLEELGFHLGDYVQVKCENGQLIITPDVNKAQEQEAKMAFMDEEIKKLKIRYQNEKEVYHNTSTIRLDMILRIKNHSFTKPILEVLTTYHSLGPCLVKSLGMAIKKSVSFWTGDISVVEIYAI